MFRDDSILVHDILGKVYAFTRWRRPVSDDIQARDVFGEDRAYARQTLRSIAQFQDEDPFNYRLYDVWQMVFQKPWTRPATLDDLIDDLAEAAHNGELFAYMEYSLAHAMMKASLGPGGGAGASDGGDADGEAEEPRTLSSQPVTHPAPESGSASSEVTATYIPSDWDDGEWTTNILSSTHERDYSLVNMNHAYSGENDPSNSDRWNKPYVVEYLSDVERAKLELDLEDGMLVKMDTREVFDTSDSDNLDGAIFVMDPSGKIFASTDNQVYKFHHSSLSAGQPVAAAGELVVIDGVLCEVTNKSGHYMPSLRMNNQLFDELERRGMPKNKLDQVIQSGWLDDGFSTESRPHKYFRDKD